MLKKSGINWVNELFEHRDVNATWRSGDVFVRCIFYLHFIKLSFVAKSRIWCFHALNPLSTIVTIWLQQALLQPVHNFHSAGFNREKKIYINIYSKSLFNENLVCNGLIENVLPDVFNMALISVNTNLLRLGRIQSRYSLSRKIYARKS